MTSIQHLMTALAVAACLTPAFAKLPAPTEEAKAKAAETKARADWQAKVDAYQLCKAQDRVAGRFKNRTAAGQGSAATVKPAAAAPTAAASSAGGPPPASAGAGTPVAAAPPQPCAEPGAFTYASPEQKPLESAGAHSPSATAASPPSAKPHSGEFPAKK